MKQGDRESMMGSEMGGRGRGSVDKTWWEMLFLIVDLYAVSLQRKSSEC